QGLQRQCLADLQAIQEGILLQGQKATAAGQIKNKPGQRGMTTGPLLPVRRRKATEVPMKGLRLVAISTVASVLQILASGYTGLAQTPVPPPPLAPPLISLAEARVIIDGAIAFTREQNLNMAVVVVDAAGNLVSADKMDGTTINNTRFA